MSHQNRYRWGRWLREFSAQQKGPGLSQMCGVGRRYLEHEKGQRQQRGHNKMLFWVQISEFEATYMNVN